MRARHAGALASVALVLAALAVPLGRSSGAEGDCTVVEDFSKSKVGEFPAGWKARKKAGEKAYTVEEQDGKRFLHAVSHSLGIQAAKEFEWDPNTHPVLAWSWRPLVFPTGADERRSKTNDSAVSVYAVWPYSSFAVKSVKYAWSEVVPVGTHLTLSHDLTQVRVLQSGAEKKGAWVEERVNVVDDYKRFFDERQVPKAAGIAVLSDSDDTKSTSSGDYADFRVCRQ